MSEYVVKALPRPLFKKNPETGVIEKWDVGVGDTIELSDAAAEHLAAEGYIDLPETEE